MLDLNHNEVFIPENFDTEELNKVFCVARGHDLLINDKNQNLAVLNQDEIKWSGMDINQEYFLGYLEKKACYVAELSPDSLCMEGTSLRSFRSLLGIIPDNFFTICARSIQLLEWNRVSKFCGSCGLKTTLHKLERAMHCEKCNNFIYPKISPCIIVLVTKDEEMLLAHNKNFPNQIFSTLAGFIETGETVEEAIKREIYEEVKIRVNNFSYFGSQSWPFPNQLMLGFFAKYKSGEIEPDGNEIDEASWFHFKSLPQVPPANISISGKLIEAYSKELTKKNLPGFT